MIPRRDVLAAGLTLAGAAALGVPDARAASLSRVRPGQPGWPSEADWEGLKRAVGGRLGPVVRPDLSDPEVRRLIADPFYVGEQPGLTQSSGWLDAWRYEPSRYVVTAHDAADVAAAVRFARTRNLRLVVRGGAHSYLGCSTAPDSLMIWTRRMNAIQVHEAFTPKGSKAAPVPAVSCGAGAIWMHAYQAVTNGAGRYVQGGGCTTVGVAGLVQGGGFGSYSKRYGTVAASLLEAEIVTADGEVRVVNPVRDPDLFWALKGGGGGTFGVVTRVTLATHALPPTFGAFRVSIKAKSDAAYRRLIGRFVEAVAPKLCSPHWGEQVHMRPDNRLSVEMSFADLTGPEAKAVWQPLLDFAKANAADYEGQDQLLAIPLPARSAWDADFFRKFAPDAVKFDKRPGAQPDDYWWAGDGEQVGVFWYAYSSAWLPARLLKPQNQASLVDALFEASRHHEFGLHFNKGLYGATPEVIAASRHTAMNPEVLDAFALVILGSAGPPAFPGLPTPDVAQGAASHARVQKATAALLKACPGAGAYVNECDFFQPDWQRAFWGPHYGRLAKVKRRVDPTGLFTVHHGVGSEGWSDDGFTRRA